MKSLSLKLQESVLQQAELNLNLLKMTRNAYFSAAIEHFNSFQKRSILEARLRAESALVAANSMEVLREMERLEDLPESTQLVENQSVTKSPSKKKGHAKV